MSAGAVQYGGDEISALVLDPGSHATRAGYAGEDAPKSYIPTSYGLRAASATTPKQSFYSDSSIHAPRPDYEIKNPMHEGTVADFDAASDLWQYIFNTGLRADPHEHPLMMTETSWVKPQQRQKTMEIAFETLGSPAAYLLKGGVAAAFASGKSTALVVDIGHSVTSVTPVYDGIILKRGLQKQAFAGAALSEQVNALLKQRGVDVTPHFLVQRKGAPETGSGAVLKEVPGLSDSFMQYERGRIVEAFKEHVLQVFEGPLNEQAAASRPARMFEFPTGRQELFKQERFAIAESLFTTDESHQSLQAMMQASLSVAEVDIRPALLSNIIVTGASSLIPGLEQRLQLEMAKLFPGARLRISAAGNTVERKCAGWLGGSILASLGTFHQLWLSKEEYSEQGADRLALIERRCK
ncbi:actin-1 [Protomyces lactucae-debilis]|uniref:Actin-1 n=1 Tax=Protomyces lactucae-debilis TaxID=2754530 RepID=A0A1Y2FH57_PROLT|nr:actin-1 [Protomyces lactucae-debilis]ORY83291.1 actin-1 [Protomyces lactucae-debilis]